jgi:hypothetical protein
MKDEKNPKHPVGTGVGAAGGAAAGAMIGTAVAGPAGTLAGGAIGAAAGALAGQGVAEAIDPTVEEKYWRDNYSTRNYVDRGANYNDYGPAYRYGWESRSKYGNKTYDDIESDLERGWDTAKANSSLAWSKAKHAVRDAWHHVERAMPGDADNDGR